MRFRITTRRIRKFAAPVAAVSLTIGLFAPPSAASDSFGLRLAACPEYFNGARIVVPGKVGFLANDIPVCETRTFYASVPTTPPPSVAIVIDNSGSMRGSSGNDPTSLRFIIVKCLLDSLLKIRPNAEVSLVVFRDQLYFDPTTPPYFSKYFKRLPATVADQPNQAYLQPLTLDSLYSGRRGVDIIKDVLTTRIMSDSVDLVYRPNFQVPAPEQGSSFVGETNYNIAFDAVREAFKSSTIPHDRQSVVFITDGIPCIPYCMETTTDVDYYQAGTNMPATYTLVLGVTTAPQSLQNMTQNIRANGYSASNQSSDLWAVRLLNDTLVALLLQKILPSRILSGDVRRTAYRPVAMRINGIQAVAAIKDSGFHFANNFPLAQGTTHFGIEIGYHTVSSWVLAGDTVAGDTTVLANFDVVQNDSLGPTWGIAVDYPLSGVKVLSQNRIGGATWTRSAAVNRSLRFSLDGRRVLPLEAASGPAVEFSGEGGKNVSRSIRILGTR